MKGFLMEFRETVAYLLRPQVWTGGLEKGWLRSIHTSYAPSFFFFLQRYFTMKCPKVSVSDIDAWGDEISAKL